jgi:hypothetical protein
MGWWNSVGCDSFWDETYGNIKTLGNNIWGHIVGGGIVRGCIEQGKNVQGCNIWGHNIWRHNDGDIL